MGTETYDAVVVGARCAGSPTAMLLAAKGYKILVVDRATFPSDTISTHLIHPPGVEALHRWGLLDRVVGTGCPPIDRYVFDFGPVVLEGAPGTDAFPVAYAPRRTELDRVLVTAAREAGADVIEGFTVDDLQIEDGRVRGVTGNDSAGRSRSFRADVVIGADGRNSLVARAVGPHQYSEKPRLLAAYYSYYAGLPMGGRFESYVRPERGFAAWPTNDDLTVVIAGWPFRDFESNKTNVEGNFVDTLALAPDFAERVAAAERRHAFVGAAVPNFFRKPFGPGWALVGDAAYNKDFITAQGIQDAFRDAELCAGALDASWSGAETFEDAMTNYQRRRDELVMPMYEFTAEIASLEPPPPELQALLGATAGNPAAMDAFMQMAAGVVSPAEFFSDENVGRIMSAAQPDAVKV